MTSPITKGHSSASSAPTLALLGVAHSCCVPLPFPGHNDGGGLARKRSLWLGDLQRRVEPPPGSTSPACRQGCSLPKLSCCVEGGPAFLSQQLSGSDVSKVSIPSSPACHGPSLKRHDLQELAGECTPLRFLSVVQAGHMAGALLAIPSFTKMARMLKSVDNLGPSELHHPHLWLISDL